MHPQAELDGLGVVSVPDDGGSGSSRPRVSEASGQGGAAGLPLDEWEAAGVYPYQGGVARSRPVSAYRTPSGGGRTKFTGLPLAVINARLEQLMAEHLWDERGGLADFAALRGADGGAGLEATLGGCGGGGGHLLDEGAGRRT